MTELENHSIRRDHQHNFVIHTGGAVNESMCNINFIGSITDRVVVKRILCPMKNV